MKRSRLARFKAGALAFRVLDIDIPCKTRCGEADQHGVETLFGSLLDALLANGVRLRSSV